MKFVFDCSGEKTKGTSNDEVWKIKVEKLLGICDHIVKNENQHWVSPSFLCRITKGEPKIMEPTKHTDMQWFNLHALPENLTITTKHAVKHYKEEEG